MAVRILIVSPGIDHPGAEPDPFAAWPGPPTPTEDPAPAPTARRPRRADAGSDAIGAAAGLAGPRGPHRVRGRRGRGASRTSRRSPGHGPS